MDNTPVIGIVEWLERYEVSSKGREAKPGDELKSSPLQFVRLKVFGHTQSTGFRRLKSVAGKRTMEVFGFFCKFLEIAGNQKSEQRGILLNEKNKPASAEDLAFILDVPLEQVKNALKVLSNEKVGWITYNSIQNNLIEPNLTQPKGPGKSGKVRENPANPANPGDSGNPKDNVVKKFSKPTPEEVEAYGTTIGFAIDGHEFVDFYESKGWVIGKNKMKDWKASVRTWKNRRKGNNGAGRVHRQDTQYKVPAEYTKEAIEI